MKGAIMAAFAFWFVVARLAEPAKPDVAPVVPSVPEYAKACPLVAGSGAAWDMDGTDYLIRLSRCWEPV